MGAEGFRSTVQFRSGRLAETARAESKMLSRVDGIALVERAHPDTALDWVSTSHDLCFAYGREGILATVVTARRE
jgi:uncharacterized iron-regulated membrane protein